MKKSAAHCRPIWRCGEKGRRRSFSIAKGQMLFPPRLHVCMSGRGRRTVQCKDSWLSYSPFVYIQFGFSLVSQLIFIYSLLHLSSQLYYITLYKSTRGFDIFGVPLRLQDQ